jgi:hypothetical protein
MTMADVFTVVFVFLGLLLAMPATWLLFSAIAPRGVARAQYRARRMPVVAFFVGLGTISLFVATVAALAATSLAPLQTLAFLVAASGMAFTMYGVSGVARQIGAMLPSAIDRDNPWRSHLRGGIVLELSFLIPVLGWFLILPATLVVGAGAATLSLLLRASPEFQLQSAPGPLEKAGAAL